MNFELRKWRAEDVSNLVKHANNYKVSQYLADEFPYPYTFKDGEKYIDFVLNTNPTKEFAIVVDGEAVGCIGLFSQLGIHRKNAELGYWLSEYYWGKGIMVRAIEKMIEYGFNTFDIIRIFACPFIKNKQSIRVLQKAGFTEEAIFTKAIFKNNEYIDEIYFSIYKNQLFS